MFSSKVYFWFCVFFVYYLVNASAFSCKSADPAGCKSEVVQHLENELIDKYSSIASGAQAKIADVLSAAADDLPPNDPHTVILRDSVKKIKEDIAQVPSLAVIKDAVKLGDIKYRFIVHVDPDLSRADKEDSSNVDLLRSSIVKHGDNRKLIIEAVANMMVETNKVWNDVYSGLRDSDKQANPIYNQINEINQKLTNGKDMLQKYKLGILLLQSLSKLDDDNTPYIKGLVRALYKHCNSDNVCDFFPKILSQSEVKELGNAFA